MTPPIPDHNLGVCFVCAAIAPLQKAANSAVYVCKTCADAAIQCGAMTPDREAVVKEKILTVEATEELVNELRKLRAERDTALAERDIAREACKNFHGASHDLARAKLAAEAERDRMRIDLDADERDFNEIGRTLACKEMTREGIVKRIRELLAERDELRKRVEQLEVQDFGMAVKLADAERRLALHDKEQG